LLREVLLRIHVDEWELGDELAHVFGIVSYDVGVLQTAVKKADLVSFNLAVTGR
jgi:hypothetical protein